MDMALYALLKNQLSEQTECKTWNGFKIEVVDKLPEKQIPNTIYFVKSNITIEDAISISSEEQRGDFMDMVLYALLKTKMQNFESVSNYTIVEVDELPPLEERDNNTIYIVKKVGE